MVELVELIEQARDLDRQRLDLDRQSKMIKSEVDALSAQILQLMHEGKLTNVNGARIELKRKPYISDFSALEGYIVEHSALDLLQKRLTESAVKLRWDDGIQIPGVGVIEEEKLQLK
jgi:hypothetical protein